MIVDKGSEPISEVTAPVPEQAPQIVPVETEEEAKAFIFFKESTNRLDAQNSQGCIGLGQDCNHVLASECPDWQTNRKCQEGFWQRYMERRYKTWVAAKAHWQARVPINGKDVGNWW